MESFKKTIAIRADEAATKNLTFLLTSTETINCTKCYKSPVITILNDLQLFMGQQLQ